MNIPEILELHRLWLNDTTTGKRANLRNANLSDATGNMKEVKSLFFDTWSVTYTPDIMQIGCQTHTIEAWRTFTDEQIDIMDTSALTWWQTYKQAIFAIIDGAQSK